MRPGLLGRIGALHAKTLAGLPAVEELVLSDQVPTLAEQVAGRPEVHGTRDSLAAGWQAGRLYRQARRIPGPA
jgi:hypothetical protein